MIIVGRPPLSVGTYRSISIAPYGTGYRGAHSVPGLRRRDATCGTTRADQRRS